MPASMCRPRHRICFAGLVVSLISTCTWNAVSWLWFPSCSRAARSQRISYGRDKVRVAVTAGRVQLSDLSPRFGPAVEEELQKGYGGRWMDVCKYLMLPATLALRVNVARSTRLDVSRMLAERGVEARPHESFDDILIATPKPGGAVSSDHRHEVIVGRVCGEAVLKGANVFAPGVHSCTAFVGSGDAVVVTSDVDEVDTYGTRLDAYVGRRVEIGDGIFRMDRTQVMSGKGSGVAVEMTSRVVKAPPPANGLLPGGLLYAQGLAPAAVGHLLDLEHHHSVVDLCAGPGGKTSHFATRMVHGGASGHHVLVACDRRKSRLEQAKRVCAEWGVDDVVRYVQKDGARLSSDDGATPEDARKGGAAWEAASARGLREGVWDAVFVDPPCSALGLRPRLRHDDVSLEDVHQLAQGQRRLLSEAVRLLRGGGTLVFSTCTIMPQENEHNVVWALKELGLELQDASPAVGGPAWVGYGLSDEERRLCRRADPTLDTAGFFVAKFKKPL